MTTKSFSSLDTQGLGDRALEPPPLRWSMLDAAWFLVPVLLFLALHLRSLDYEFVWTDQGEIEYGMIIRPPGKILAAFGEPMFPTLDKSVPGATPYYRPLQVVLLSLIDHHLGRLPAHFRAFTLAAGALTLLAFGLLVATLTRDARLAALAASIVAAHPGNIEDYVWIAGMSAALCHLFIVCSLLAVAMLQRNAGVAATSWGQALLVTSAGFSCALALLSKEAGIITPALAMAVALGLAAAQRGTGVGQAFVWWGIALPRRSAAIAIAVQIAVALVYLLAIRPGVLGGSVLADRPPIAGDMGVHLMTVIATWPQQLLWLFAPLASSTSDVVQINRSMLHPLFLMGIALLISAPIVWLTLLRKRQSLAAIAWAWIWIAFLPTSGLIPLTHVVAVRYLSLSIFGASLLCLALLFGKSIPWLSAAPIGASLPVQPTRGRIALGIALVLVAFLAQRTAQRVPDWQSDPVLFGRAVERDPLYREGYFVLAVERFKARDFIAAAQHTRALRAAEDDFEGRFSFLNKSATNLLVCRIELKLEAASSRDADFRPAAAKERLRACQARESRRRKVREKLRRDRREAN